MFGMSMRYAARPKPPSNLVKKFNTTRSKPREVAKKKSKSKAKPKPVENDGFGFDI